MQRYLCRSCSKIFQSKRRPKKSDQHLWQDYTFRRQTIRDLSKSVGLSERQIRRRLKAAQPNLNTPRFDTTIPVSLTIDTTYFDSYGVMVFRCFNRRRNLLWYFVETETNQQYFEGIKILEKLGYVIAGVVCDGRPYLAEQLAKKYPIQLCQFHAMKHVRKYITKYPKTKAGKELKAITLTLTKTTQEVFQTNLLAWYQTWKLFLEETSFDLKTEKEHFTHERIRKAYAFLLRQLKFLFTYQNFPEINLPNTTNTLDGSFSQLKQKIHTHRGLNIQTQQKMIETILKNSSPVPKKKSTRNVH